MTAFTPAAAFVPAKPLDDAWSARLVAGGAVRVAAGARRGRGCSARRTPSASAAAARSPDARSSNAVSVRRTVRGPHRHRRRARSRRRAERLPVRAPGACALHAGDAMSFESPWLLAGCCSSRSRRSGTSCCSGGHALRRAIPEPRCARGGRRSARCDWLRHVPAALLLASLAALLHRVRATHRRRSQARRARDRRARGRRLGVDAGQGRQADAARGGEAGDALVPRPGPDSASRRASSPFSD